MQWRPRFRRTSDERGPVTSFVVVADADDLPGSEHHPIIRKAIDNQHEIEVMYAKPGAGAEQRVVIPTEMAPGEGGVTYLRGFDVTKGGGHKTFRTDRIQGIVDVRDRSQDPGVDPEPLAFSVPTTQKKNRTLLAEEPSLVTSDQTIKKNDPNAVRIIANPVQFMQENNAYKPKTGTIDPTPEEYEELRSKDVDPQTYDKATIRRLRNSGASHIDLLNVANQGIPYEDYEMARAITDSHDSAVQEALKMRSRDREQISQNIERNKENPNFAEPHLLDDAAYKSATKGLFVHHMNLRNAPSFSEDQNRGPIFNHPDRRRANEWIMSELTKLNPELKQQMGNTTFLENRGLEFLKGDTTRLTDGTKQISYFDPVNQLSKHHTALQATTTDLGDLTKQRRIIKALSNIANSRFYPVDYSGDVYEEA